MLVLLSVLPPSAVAAQPFQDDVDVGEDDEGGREDRAVVEGHDQLIPLELPHLVGDGLHLKEGVAVERRRSHVLSCSLLNRPEVCGRRH